MRLGKIRLSSAAVPRALSEILTFFRASCARCSSRSQSGFSAHISVGQIKKREEKSPISVRVGWPAIESSSPCPKFLNFDCAAAATKDHTRIFPKFRPALVPFFNSSSLQPFFPTLVSPKMAVNCASARERSISGTDGGIRNGLHVGPAFRPSIVISEASGDLFLHEERFVRPRFLA